MVVKIPKKLEMKSLLPAPCSPLPAHVLAFPPRDINIRLILNKEVLQRSHKRKTNLFKELITELRVGNRKIFEELAFEGMMLGLGCSLHGCSYTGITLVLLRCFIIILSCRIIRGLPNLLLQLTMNDLHQFGC
jgi:hypothetical protein